MRRSWIPCSPPSSRRAGVINGRAREGGSSPRPCNGSRGDGGRTRFLHRLRVMLRGPSCREASIRMTSSLRRWRERSGGLRNWRRGTVVALRANEVALRANDNQAKQICKLACKDASAGCSASASAMPKPCTKCRLEKAMLARSIYDLRSHDILRRRRNMRWRIAVKGHAVRNTVTVKTVSVWEISSLPPDALTMARTEESPVPRRSFLVER